MDALRLAGLDLSKEFRLARTAPAFEAGLRGGIGMAVPIFLGFAAGKPSVGTIAALGCWFTLLADIGGTYGQKARAMLAGNLAGASAILVGGAVGHIPGLASIGTFAWVFTAPDVIEFRRARDRAIDSLGEFHVGPSVADTGSCKVGSLG